MRESNSATLDQVSAFVNDAAAAGYACGVFQNVIMVRRKLIDSGTSIDQIPSAFVVTGPNIASQGLLFEQLSETLGQQSASRFVRLKSSEAVTLKAALKKTIRDAMAMTGDAEDEEMQIDEAPNVSPPPFYNMFAIFVCVAQPGEGSLGPAISRVRSGGVGGFHQAA